MTVGNNLDSSDTGAIGNIERQYYINRIQLIISYPAMFVPSLSDKEIRESIIEVVVGYFEGEIPFDILLSVIENLALFKGIREKNQLSIIINDVLSEINELSQYKNNPEPVKDTINDVLIKEIDKLL